MTGSRRIVIALVLSGLCIARIPAQAQTPPGLSSKPALTLATALAVIDAATADAAHNGWPCVVAVVDEGGWLFAMERMDHAAMLVSVELAIGKARSAALFRKPTAALEQAINGGRVAQVTAADMIQMQGGIPLRVGDDLVGAVGVSADTPDHDQAIAEAAVRAFNARVGR